MSEEKKDTTNAPKEKTFKVQTPFVYDKKYLKGQSISLSDEKTIKKLLTNNYIK